MTDVPFAQITLPRTTATSDPRVARRRLAAALHARRHGAVQRRTRAPGDPAHRRPPGDARAGALGPRPRRERHVRAVRRRLRLAAASAHQDIDQAKSLLKAAGQDGLTVDLHTTDGAGGMVDSANVFAAQAKAAGVTINVKNDPNYYGDQYLKLAFSVDFWGTRSYLPQVAPGSIPGARRTTRRTGRRRARSSRASTRRPSAAPTPPSARRSIMQMQKHGVRHRRLHHPVLQQPGRRLQLEGGRASSRARGR